MKKIFAILLVLFLPYISLTQIKIEERVEIDPNSTIQISGKENPFSMNYSDSPISKVIMLKTGLLKASYLFIVHFDYPMPDYSLFTAHFLKNNLIKIDSLKTRFDIFHQWQDYYYNYCTQGYETREGYNYVTEPEKIYLELGSVVEGDTIQFSYYSDDITTQQPIEYGVYSAVQYGTSWYLRFGNFNNCINDFDNVLGLFLYVFDEIDTLNVMIEPELLSPGDTAIVDIKRRLPGGIIEDFPPEQTFELAVLDGCVNGNVLVGDSIDVYFSNAQQPIYFVAADSIEGDSGYVRLRVGTDLYNDRMQPLTKISEQDLQMTEEKIKISVLRGSYKRMIDEKKLEQNESKSDIFEKPPIEAPIVGACYAGTYLYESGYWEGDVLVKKDGCDFDNCSDDYDDMQIQLLRQSNNFEFREGDYITVCVCDTCTEDEYPTGQSSPVPFYDRIRKNNNGEWTNSWNLIACKNVDNEIEVRPVATDINFPIPIYADFVADVCYNLISNFSGILINDTTELKDKNIIPDSELEDLLHDICGHYCYPNVITDDGYILKEAVETHELLHMSHYQKILNDTKIDSLVNELKRDLVYDCQFYQQYIKTPEGAAIDFEGKVNQYIVKADREYRKQSGVRYFDVFGNEHPGDPDRELNNELRIQQNEFLVDLIRSYHKALAKARGTDERPTCFTCP